MSAERESLLDVFGTQDAVCEVARHLREWFPYVHSDNMLGVDGREPRTDLAVAFRALLASTGVSVELVDNALEFTCDPENAAA